MPNVVAKACSNVALVKYWGKRSAALNLPFKGSISVTLGGLSTTASVRRLAREEADRIRSGDTDLGGRPEIVSFLSLLRSLAPDPSPVAIELQTSFPVAAGLASSASIFAALTLALTRAFGLEASSRELTCLARRGSGSASRSLSGGFVEWFAGRAEDGSDSFAERILAPEAWALGIVVVVTDGGPKAVASRAGMTQVTDTSPFFPAWLASQDADLDEARDAIAARDLGRLGQIAEHNCLKMHAVSLAARPALLYWNPVTLAVIQEVYRLRAEGRGAYFTIDAGPQVKVLCPRVERDAVARRLASVPGVQRTLLSEPGPAAEVVEIS